jgi:hypothetical protein
MMDLNTCLLDAEKWRAIFAAQRHKEAGAAEVAMA